KDALVGEAKAAEQLGLTDTINQTALMLAAASRNDPLGLMQAADVLFDQGQYGGAAGLYRQAISEANRQISESADERIDESPLTTHHSPLTIHGWMRLGFCHFQLSQQNATQRDENLRQAIEAYERAIDALQSTVDNLQSAMGDLNNARYHAAVAHQLLGEYEPALKLFEKVVETDEREQFRPPSLLALGELYEKEKRYDEAIRAYEGASLSLKEPKGVALALQRIGEISRLLGKYDTAIHSYQELLKRYPQSEYAPAAQYFIGVCYADAENKNIDLALAAYERVIQNYPDSELAIDAYWNAATLSDQRGNKSKAFHYAEQIIDRYAPSKDAHAQEIVYSARNLTSNLLLADATLHPNGAAILTQQLTAIASAPEATPEARANAYFELGNLHANAKDYQSAQVDYQNAKQASTSDELRTKIGYRETTLHFALGAYTKAVETGLETLQKINQSTGHQSPVTSHLYYLIGQSQMELNQIDAAAEAFQQAIGVATDRATMPEIKPFSYFYLGQIHERRGQTDQAIAEYQVVLSTIEASPNDPKAKEIRTEAARHLARIYENGEMSKSANEQMSKSVNGQSDPSPTHHSQVRQVEESRSKTGQPHPPTHQQALELYAQVIAADVNPRLTAEAIYRRGLIYQRADEPDKAMAEFSQLVNRFSKTSDAEIKAMVEDAILRLPKLSGSSGDVDAAIKTAKAALQLAQNKADPLLLAQAQFQLASLYYQSGDKKQHQSAVKLFKEAYTNALKSKDIQPSATALINAAMFQAGQAAYQSGDPQGAIHPPPAPPGRGGGGGEGGEGEESPNAIETLINAAMFQAGQAAYQSGDPQGAIQPLEDFIRRFPEDEKANAAYEYLAWSYFTVADKTQSEKDRRTRFRSAAEAFDQLVARNVNPEKTPEWMYQSAQALTLAGETAKAAVAYQKLVETYPTHALAEASLYTVGGMQFASKQYDEALKTYQRVVEQYPGGEWVDESLYAIGAAYDALKQGEKAVQAYQAVIERFPNQPVAANAQANIGHYYFNHNAYARALEAYNKLTPKNFPGMEAKLQNDVTHWRVDTENIMAETPYKEAVASLTKADTGAETPSDEEKKYALTAIGQFEKLIKDYPNSAYIDHALVSIGTAYEIRSEWEDALSAYSRLAARHQKTPTDANLQKLLDYAQGRTQAIKVFLLQKEKFGK
ncbi:tetratricopeptide repeat protein, partial [Candidatus Poribacteria bacterium]|nr:tetratricopeptide repeat protein [Candidatus Poribacteria bacterium]